jgi:hypothetical protein
MKYRMKSTQRDWAALREAYVGGQQTISEICDQFKLARSTLYARIRTEGWPLRSDPGGCAELAEEPAAGAGRARTERLLGRLFKALERQMSEIERRLIGSARNRDAAARERDARTLSSLVRTLEKLCALDAAPNPGTAAETRNLEPETVARMRQAIARRLAGIVPEGNDR